MPIRNRLVAAIIAGAVIAAGCTVSSNSPPATPGGFAAPPMSRTACVDAVAREFKVPKDSVAATSAVTTMRDGIYVVTLTPAPGRPAVNCTVDENGAVSEVIRAR
jgi:hypothetical protein